MLSRNNGFKPYTGVGVIHSGTWHISTLRNCVSIERIRLYRAAGQLQSAWTVRSVIGYSICREAALCA